MELRLTLVIGCYALSTVAYASYLFRQRDLLQRIGHGLMMVGFGVHSLSLGYAVLQYGALPARNLHETLSIAGWSVVGVYLLFQYRLHLKILGIYAAPLATLIMAVSASRSGLAAPAKPLLASVWLSLHIITIFVGEAALALACGIGLLYLLQERAIKTKQPGFFFKRLPSLELLDNAGYACIIAGFGLHTLGLITGFVYARAVWGSFWSWDPKEVWSGITWLLYAVLMHQRLTVGWRGRRAAAMAIIGFAIVVFTFVGVNFLLQGHHSEFTR